MNIGEKIKSIRKNQKLKQDDLAKLSGLSKNAIWNYENEKRIPTVETLNKIAKALNVPITELIGENNAIINNVFNDSDKLDNNSKSNRDLMLQMEISKDNLLAAKYNNLDFFARLCNCNPNSLSNDDKEMLINKITDTLEFELYKLGKSKGIKLTNEVE